MNGGGILAAEKLFQVLIVEFLHDSYRCLSSSACTLGGFSKFLGLGMFAARWMKFGPTVRPDLEDRQEDHVEPVTSTGHSMGGRF